MSARGIALALTTAWRGEMVKDPYNMDNAREWKGDVLFRIKRGEQVRGTEGSSEARDESVFHPRADDLARKARRLSLLPITSDDGAYFSHLTSAWVATCRGHDWIKSHASARLCCDFAGELPLFSRAMEPILNHRFNRGPPPAFLLPDFIPHDVA
jgi:hypothetical protein